MNLLDLLIIAIIAFSVVSGAMRGFTLTVLRFASFFVSAFLAYLLYPVLARLLGSTVLSALPIYVEGSEYISNVDLSHQLVSALSPAQIDSVVQNANLPAPFSTALHNNIANQSLAPQNAATLGDYFNITITNVLLGLVCFLALFLLFRLILGIVINTTNYVTRLPVLKQFNALLGGALGLVRGVLMVFALFLLAPVLTVVMGGDTVTQYINGSLLGPFFSNANFLLSFIGGVL
jgi:uncharacterized membrane protein required for colicin V production